uniref:Essential protein Yae1 N-terminal domain-containing protein n=1 Tax=Ananas comosus var. bracteatus TaxID=296719 RepID=A0A6V7PBW6_ANACO|nr:unnamed protein product [Ananas comosus var. bracteatus]
MAEGTSANHEDLRNLMTSLAELSMETASFTEHNQRERHDNGSDDCFGEDEIWGDASDDDVNHGTALSREWEWRHNRFHTMGYRDGITEGKQASAQEGFNIGFKQSVLVGYKWGLVRGITSAIASLPENLREKLVPKSEIRKGFENLHTSVQTISTTDALKMYHKSIAASEAGQSSDHSEQKLQDEDSNANKLETLSNDLILLLHETPEIKITEEELKT